MKNNQLHVFRMALISKTLITQQVHKLEASTVLTHSNPAQVSETFVTEYSRGFLQRQKQIVIYYVNKFVKESQ